MSVVRSRVPRALALLLLAGSLALGLARPARAGQEFFFSQVLPLEEAQLRTIDVFGAFWWFNGQFRLDTRLFIDNFGNCRAKVLGFTESRGFNYRLGTFGWMKIFFLESVKCRRDPVDGVLRAKIPFLFKIVGPGGGELPAEMRIAITPAGVKVTGVTLGDDL